jgi:signal peptidase I
MKPLVLVWRTAAVVVLAVLALPLIWEKSTGDYYMTVTGSSMVPTYHRGDVLVVQKPTGDDLQTVGQPVIVSKKAGDRTQQYVHRVHELSASGAVLKGDGNEDVDPGFVTQDLVMGTPRVAMTDGLAAAYRFTQSWGGRIVIAILLLPAFIVPARRRIDSAATNRK